MRSREIALESVGREVVLHDRARGRVHVLNGPAARLWQLCDGSHGLEEAAQALASSYGVAASAVGADVARIVDRFRSLGLLA